MVGAFQNFGTSSNRRLFAYHLVENEGDAAYDENTPLSMQNIDLLLDCSKNMAIHL